MKGLQDILIKNPIISTIFLANSQTSQIQIKKSIKIPINKNLLLFEPGKSNNNLHDFPVGFAKLGATKSASQTTINFCWVEK
jgi:hypothetical protein